MDEEEVSLLILLLEKLLIENGFDWIVHDVDLNLEKNTRGRREHVLSLINAAESVTVDLGRAEKAVLSKLNVETIEFFDEYSEQPIDASLGEGSFFQRNEELDQLIELSSTFEELRELVDVQD